MTVSPDIVHAYRHLLRSALRAVHFSKPARYAIHNQLRAGFRERGAQLDSEAIGRTLQFLDAARAERGLEHRILKNLLRVAWERRRAAEKMTWATVVRGRAATKQDAR
jgi:hypothetical protein